MTKKKNKHTREEPVKDAGQQSPQSEETSHKEDKGTAKDQKKKTKTDCEEKLADMQEKYDDLNEKYKRLYSDFDNARKRHFKERLELIKTASGEVIEDLLPVLDDFERALQSFREQDMQDEAVQGVELIYNKLFNTLKQKGLEPMDSKGKEFNTDYHEAITQIPAESEDMKGKVFDVTTRGYLLNGKIIRHAKVVVSV